FVVLDVDYQVDAEVIGHLLAEQRSHHRTQRKLGVQQILQLEFAAPVSREAKQRLGGFGVMLEDVKRAPRDLYIELFGIWISRHWRNERFGWNAPRAKHGREPSLVDCHVDGIANQRVVARGPRYVHYGPHAKDGGRNVEIAPPFQHRGELRRQSFS